MAKHKRCLCTADLNVVRGRFAMVALAELDNDPSWSRLIKGLTSLMVGSPTEPL